MHPVTEPTLAEQARTALARATAATLHTKGCAPHPGTITVVSVQDQPDGSPVVRIESSSPTARELAGCRVATIAVAAESPFRRLEISGRLEPCRADTRPGQRAFRLSVLSCRLVGTTSVGVPLQDFHTAAPDPLHRIAPTLLDHLREAHSQDLLACVRAHDHDTAEAVVPLAVDRYGIELGVLGGDGVERVRLPFPGGPVDSLRQVPHSHVVPLSCRCRAGREAH